VDKCYFGSEIKALSIDRANVIDLGLNLQVTAIESRVDIRRLEVRKLDHEGHNSRGNQRNVYRVRRCRLLGLIFLTLLLFVALPPVVAAS
jgi:hypothetical protein